MSVKLAVDDSDARRFIREMSDSMPGVVLAALMREGLAIEQISIDQVPVDTGRLRASRQTTPHMDYGRPSVVVSYGTDYAAAVHENQTARHPNGGKAKFLQDPYMAATVGFFGRVAAFIRAKMGLPER